MNQILTKLFSVNYRTSITGLGVIVAALGRFVLAYRSKHYDFMALADDGQLIMTTLAGILAGLGLFVAKDSSVVGAGAQAKSVDSTGTVTNIEGQVIAKQSDVPPQPKL